LGPDVLHDLMSLCHLTAFSHFVFRNIKVAEVESPAPLAELNPTPAMAALLKMRQEKEEAKKNKKRKKPLFADNEGDSEVKSKR
jgi:hypothetical protein